MAIMHLSDSVGAGGRNVRPDVLAVQTLLTHRGQRPGAPDGLCGPRTIAAIKMFQARFMRTPDGLVGVDGLTWQRLVHGTIPGLHGPGAAGPAGGGLQLPPPKPPSSGPAVPAKDPSMTELLPKPEKGTFNAGLKAVSNKMMKEMFGNPRETYSQDCQAMTNAKLKRNVVSESVGPFKATGLKPAVASLKQVFSEISVALPLLAPRVGTAGMLCCRYQRGSTTAISNHSWGTAVDLTINGILDKRGDNKVQVGLTLIAPFFNKHGWYWGAMFGTEDAMHFEASVSLAEKIKAELS